MLLANGKRQFCVGTGAIGNVFSQHKFASSSEEASEFCIKAGCDWNCGEGHFGLL